MIRKTLLPVIGLLIVAWVATSCSASSESAGPTDLEHGALSSDAQAALSPDADMLVPVQHVMEAFDAGVDMTFVDARPDLDYEFGHIPDALSIPYYDAAPHLSALDPDDLYIVYCECPHAEAVQVADEMTAAGFTNAKVIDEGLYGWTQAGGATVGGTAMPAASDA